MKDSFNLSILTPERAVYDNDVKSLSTENELGKFEILPNHVDMIASINPAVTYFTEKNGEKRKVFTSTGILRVNDNKVQILCDTAEWPEEIDLQRAEEAKKRAETRLSEKDNVDLRRVEVSLKRALARIKTKE